MTNTLAAAIRTALTDDHEDGIDALNLLDSLTSGDQQGGMSQVPTTHPGSE
jgi:hypothetical protein